METIWKAVRKVRIFCFVSTPDYFIKQQNKVYTTQQILQSLQEITTGMRFSQERSIKTILKNLHRILFYVCNTQAYDKQIEEFIQNNQLNLVMSTIQLLRLYRSYLKKIVPTNATYFHFLRDSEFYLHYTVVRYVLIVGDSHNLRNICEASLYNKINAELKKTIFGLLIEWLYDLVDYRNSAIYVKNTTIEHLISSTFILVCGLLGPSDQNAFSLLQKASKKDLFNKLMFLSIYILCDTISNNKKNKYYLVSMSINCLRKMLAERDIPDIDIFIPSYFYVDMIGFINCPLTYQIVMRVLVCFLNEGFQREEKRKQREEKRMHQDKHLDQNFNESNSTHSENDESEDLFFVSPLTEINIWGVINLIIEKYGTYNKTVLESFLTKIIPSLQPQSLTRAYCVKIIHQLGIESSNHVISNFYQKSQFDYLVDDKLLSIDLVIKNFRTFMETIYSSNVQEAVMEKEVVLSAQNIFKYLLEFNVEEIRTINENLHDNNEVESEVHFTKKTEKITDLRKSSKQAKEENVRLSGKQVKKQTIQGLDGQQNGKQYQTDPHLKESMFYEKRNKSDIYEDGLFGGKKERFHEHQIDEEKSFIE